MISLDNLVKLFTGDEFSSGYSCPSLILEICRQLQPSDTAEVRKSLYGQDVDTRYQLDESVSGAIDNGFAAWEALGKPSARQTVAA